MNGTTWVMLAIGVVLLAVIGLDELTRRRNRKAEEIRQRVNP